MPKNVPKKNVAIGTLIIGDDIFINQFGKNGVMRRNMI